MVKASKCLSVVLFLATSGLWCDARGAVIVDGSAREESNSIPGIDRGDPSNNIPPDVCLRTRRFKRLQSALYALEQGLLVDNRIEIATAGPLQGWDMTVPTGVRRHIEVRIPVEIVATSTTRPIINTGLYPVIISTASRVTWRGITFRGGSRHNMLARSGGTSGPFLILDDIIMDGAGWSGLVAYRATIRATNLRVTGAHNHGILLRQGCNAELRNTTVTGSGDDGICVLERSGCEMYVGTVSNNGGHGWVVLNGTAIIENATVNTNTKGGIYTLDGGFSLIRLSTISQNLDHGVTFWRNGQGRLTDCTIEHNQGRGVSIYDCPTRFRLMEVRSRHNERDGLYVNGASALHVSDGDFDDNDFSGILVNQVPTSLIETSKINNNTRHGIFALGPGQITIRDNPEINDNDIRGINLTDGMRGVISGNPEIKTNKEGGISVRLCPQRVQIIGNTIEDNGVPAPHARLGAGILIIDNSIATIQGNTIKNNHSRSSGGGICVDASSALIGERAANKQNKILENRALDGIGGGVLVSNGGYADLIANTISLNRAILGGMSPRSSGGGIAVFSGSRVTMRGNDLVENVAESSGGGMWIDRSTGTVIGSNSRNDRNTFRNNRALDGDGGGIFLVGGNAEIVNNDFDDNRATSARVAWGYGGGLSARDQYTGTLTGNIFQSNRAKQGGGIYALESTPVIGDGTNHGINRISDNTATDTRAVGVPPAVGVGAGLMLDKCEQVVVNRNAVYANNGVGVYIHQGKENTILKTFIGRDLRRNPAPNLAHGLVIDKSSDNTIGKGNFIADNRGDGIVVFDLASVGNTITRNSITNNRDMGIRLTAGGNRGLAPPIFTEVTARQVTGMASQPPSSVVEFFVDGGAEGERYLGFLTVGPFPHFTYAGRFANNGRNVTMTITHLDGNTSEFTNGLLEFVNDTGAAHVVDMSDLRAQFLRIGRWGGDIAGGGLDGYNPAAPHAVLNGPAAAPWANTIDRDPHRFHLRFRIDRLNRDPAAQEDARMLIGTFTPLGALMLVLPDDDFTEVRLQETGPNTGIFVSRSQMLTGPDLPVETFTDGNGDGHWNAPEPFVDADGNGAYTTDNPDDDFQFHDGFAGPVMDDAAGDRTHRTNVDGWVWVRYQQANAANPQWMNAPVFQRNPETRHRIDVQIYVFNEPWRDTNGNGVWNAPEPFIDISAGAVVFGVGGNYGSIWTPQQVDRTISFMRSYLATEGIRLNILGRTQLNPPGALFTHSMGQIDIGLDNATMAVPSRDDALLQPSRSAVNRDAPTNNDIVDMFFAAPITPADGAAGMSWAANLVLTLRAAGLAIAPTMMNQIIIGYQTVTRNLPAVPAHEMMHILTNTGDVGTPAYMYFPQGNRAVGGEGTVWNRYRRMQAATANQATTVRAAPGLPPGNHLLRAP